jgi:hypothetical protein
MGLNEIKRLKNFMKLTGYFKKIKRIKKIEKEVTRYVQKMRQLLKKLKSYQVRRGFLA